MILCLLGLALLDSLSEVKNWFHAYQAKNTERQTIEPQQSLKPAYAPSSVEQTPEDFCPLPQGSFCFILSKFEMRWVWGENWVTTINNQRKENPTVHQQQHAVVPSSTEVQRFDLEGSHFFAQHPSASWSVPLLQMKLLSPLPQPVQSSQD